MNARAVLFVLGNLLMVFGGCQLAPLVASLFYEPPGPQRTAELLTFSGSALVCVLLGLAARRFLSAYAEGVRLREGFAIVTFSWLLMVAVGMVPYLAVGVCGVTDAFFETMAGFTTTGATIFPRVEVLPRGTQFWRCMTQWLGGMGVVVLSVALLPILGVGGYRLLKAEAPGGVAYERERPRITDAAKELWQIYIALSCCQCLLLMVSGMSFYDALCHTFTTMSTGGFSPHSASIGHFTNPWTQWVIILFMFLAGANFSVHALALRGRFAEAVQSRELWAYTGIMLAVVLLGLLVVPCAGGGLAGWERRLRDVTFQVVSITTTTGYGTADYDAWPQIMRLLMVLLMFVGGCMGSTGGGMKAARLLIYVRTLLREFHRLVYPHGVRPVRLGTRVLDEKIVNNVLAFGMIYVACFVFGAVVMGMYDYDLATALSASASAIGNVGPGLARVGPTQNWGHLPALAKWVMSFLMLLGRLEIYSVLVLLTPWVWKR